MKSNHIPDLFLERLKKIVPPEFFAKGDFSFTLKAFAAFRVNTLKSSPDEVFHFLKEKAIAWEPLAWSKEAFIVPQECFKLLLDSALSLQGKIYAQSLSSQLPALVLGPRPGERVLDLCAAPGSKTSQIAALMQNEGELVANEAIKARFFRLKSVCQLLGVKARCTLVDGRRFMDGENMGFDRILVDAPCSSEGRFNADEKESFQYWSKYKIEEMAHKQKGLLLSALRLLKPGGTLVYSTCTFAPEENEGVIDWLFKKAPGEFNLAPINLPQLISYPALLEWGKRSFTPQVMQSLRVLPTAAMEGFFIAKLVKN